MGLYGRVWCCLLFFVGLHLCGQTPPTPGARGQPTLIEVEGRVEVALAGRPVWDRVLTNQLPLKLFPGDLVRTGERSRALVRLSDQSPYRVDAITSFQVPADSKSGNVLNILRGVIYLFHRDRPGIFPVGTPTWSATVRGTEFNLAIAEDGTAVLTLLDGAVDIATPDGDVQIKSGEAAIIQPGKPPERRPVIGAVNVIQWALYYPAILDADELGLSEENHSLRSLATSLDAYRRGDLLESLEKYPADAHPLSDAEKVYLAGLSLAVGQVDDAQRLVTEVEDKRRDGVDAGAQRLMRLAGALRTVVAAVKQQPHESSSVPVFASEWLAQSYYHQSQHRLEDALEAAQEAARKSPGFGFAWARLAELQFSFGRTGRALEAVNKSLELAPRNAEALAIKGFLLAAQNRISEARGFFEQAILADGALGNAWLGRGLVRIRSGDAKGGREDLQTAAVLEPNRALLRSYLAKGFNRIGDTAHSVKELELAKTLDPSDPTAWLYSALLKQEQNQINEAIEDLEQSQDLNNNRALYRSRLLLDQDAAVRGVNLASIYNDAGLSDVSVWEASRAVDADYASFSAHLFLADSYQRLRTLGGVDLRYETPAINEYLVASLLAPVGAGTLAHSVSQQEYSKLFASDGLGFASTTEYLSRGAWRESAAQYGTFGNFGYALSGFYQRDPGENRNAWIDQTEYSLQLQQQITPSDTAYFRAISGEIEAGDLARYYDPNQASPARSIREKQEPLLLLGHHHEWAPGIHTLFLAGRLQDRFRGTNGSQQTLLLGRNDRGVLDAVLPLSIEQDYRNDLEIYTAELQQIWQAHSHTVVAGGRYQTGEFRTENTHGAAQFVLPFLFRGQEKVTTDFRRWSVYAYDTWQLWQPLSVTAGVTYDRLTFPENFRFAPLSDEEDTTARVSPKAGFVLTPWRGGSIRFAYSKSLGGVSFDQSFRLEPIQVAGFNQTYRSLIPESVAGANSAARFETWGVLAEQRIARKTYLGVGGEILQSKVDRTFGAYQVAFNPFAVTRESTREHLDFVERSALASLNQLIGNDWSFGIRYRLSEAELQARFPNIPATATPLGGFRREQELQAVLHETRIFGIFNHPTGLFAQSEAIWYGQRSQGYSPGLASEDMWQFNAFAGYRFARRHAEARLGLLNITGQDYRLNPLNFTHDIPRSRTLVASFRFYF